MPDSGYTGKITDNVMDLSIRVFWTMREKRKKKKYLLRFRGWSRREKKGVGVDRKSISVQVRHYGYV